MSAHSVAEDAPCRFEPLQEHKASECPLCHPGGWMRGQTCDRAACRWCVTSPKATYLGEPS